MNLSINSSLQKKEQYNSLNYTLFTEVILHVDLRVTQILNKYSSLKVVWFFITKINLWIHGCHNSLLNLTLQHVQFSVLGKLPVLSVFIFQLTCDLPEIHYENKQKFVCLKSCFIELIRRTALLKRHFSEMFVRLYFGMRWLLM